MKSKPSPQNLPPKKKNQAENGFFSNPMNSSSLWVPHWILLGLFGFWSYWVLKTYFAKRLFTLGFSYLEQIPFGWFLQVPLPLLGTYVQTVFFTLGILLIAFHFGDFLIRRFFRIEFEERFQWICFSIGLGFISVFFITLLLGISQILYQNLIRALYWGLLIFSIFRHRQCRYPWNVFRSFSSVSGFSFTDKILAAIMALFILLNAILIFVPEIFYDALVYHLVIPRYYLLHHGIQDMSFLASSTFPLAIHLIWVWPLALQAHGEILIHSLHFAMGVLTVLTMYGFCRSTFNRTVGLLAALFYYSITYVIMNSWTCGNDVANNFTFILAQCALIHWFRKKESLWWVLLALFSGFLISAKYTGIFGLAALMLVWIVIQIKERPLDWKKAIQRTSIASIIVLALWSPWLIKNYIYTGNPIHPFLAQRWGAQNINRNTILDPNVVIPGSTQNIFHWDWKRFLTSPWWVTMDGEDSVRAVGPVLLLCVPLIFFIRRLSGELHILTWTFWCSYLFWFMGDPLIRYLSTLTSVSILAAYAMVRMSEHFFPFLRSSIILFCGIIVLTNWGNVLAIVHFNHRPWGVLAGKESRDQFLSYSRGSYPNPSYKILKYINENLPKEGTKILFIGENKAYYIERDFINASVEFSMEPITKWLSESSTPDDLYKILTEKKVSHFLVNYREAIRNSWYKVLEWKQDERERFDQFWKKYVEQVALAEGVYLYRIRTPEELARTAVPPYNLLDALNRKGWSNETFFNELINNSQWDGAIDEVEMMIRYGRPAYGFLASLYLRRGKEGDPDRAIPLYQKAVQTEPKVAENHFQLAILFARKGDIASAQNAIQSAVALDPSNPNVQQLYQRLHQRPPQ